MIISMFEAKRLTQCAGCYREVTCGIKEQAAEAFEKLAEYGFIEASCKHYLGDAPRLELPVFLREKRTAVMGRV